MTDVTTQDIAGNLAQFTGTENCYRHWMGYRYTDGVKYLAEACKAYWLLDVVFSHAHTNRKCRAERFLVVRLVVKDGKATFTMHSDWDQRNPKAYPALCRQRIQYTDFPLDGIKLYLIDRTLMLTSEY